MNDLGRRILVTGGTGFIGSRLVDELCRRGIKVAVLTRSPNAVIERWPHSGVVALGCDLASGAGVKEACHGADAVFHLAGYAHAEDAGTVGANLHWRTTVEGTRALLGGMEAAAVKRIVFLSSVKAMGEGGEACFDESTPCVPTTPYGRAKLEAERLILEDAAHRGMHAAVLRLPLVYGPGSKGNLPRLVQAIARGWFPPPPKIENRRSMVHVDDVVQAALLAAVNPVADGMTYVVTDGQTYSTRQIYEWICVSLGRSIPRWSVPELPLRVAARAGDVLGRLGLRRVPFNSAAFEKLFGSACYSLQKIASELGYQPRHGLRESIDEMAKTYQRGRGSRSGCRS